MPASITLSQKIPVTVEYKTNAGALADIQDMPTFESSDTGIFTVEDVTHPSLGTYSAFLVAQGIGNDVPFTVSGDGDLGDGVVLISLTDMLSVSADGAASASMSFGTAVPK